MKFKKGDEIQVVTGKDKGKKGKIEKVFTKENKVLIPNINTYKKHVKARMQGQNSEIITITKPLPLGNVALICPNCKKLSRIGYKIDGKNKTRICKKCGKGI